LGLAQAECYLVGIFPIASEEFPSLQTNTTHDTASIAAFLQSVIYGGATGGLFSVFQSLGATAVAPPLFQTLAGLGTATAGAWLRSSNGTREDRDAGENPPAEGGTTPGH